MIAQFMLDMNWEIASSYIPSRFNDELQGIADASGVSLTRLKRANILPELTQAHCTVFGAWGEATLNKRLLHLRALDWDDRLPTN
jgi:hypothetical protein